MTEQEALMIKCKDLLKKNIALLDEQKKLKQENKLLFKRYRETMESLKMVMKTLIPIPDVIEVKIDTQIPEIKKFDLSKEWEHIESKLKEKEEKK